MTGDKALATLMACYAYQQLTTQADPPMPSESPGEYAQRLLERTYPHATHATRKAACERFIAKLGANIDIAEEFFL